MRYVWFAVIALTLIVPAVLIREGYEYNAHTASTVGGPVVFGFSIVAAVAFVLILWLVFGVFAAMRGSRKAVREIDQTEPETNRDIASG